MNSTAFIWLVAIPLFSSPLVYLLGRVGVKPNAAAGRSGLVRWTAFIAMLATWAPFVLALRDFAAHGPSQFWIESIWLRGDGLSLLLAGVVLTLGTLVTLYSGPYMADEVGEEKYYAMLLAMIGVIIGLGYASDLFNLWVWFEAMAVSSYLLVAFYRRQPASLEAGMKYLVQSATGSALVLLGIALLLAQTGTLNLDEIRTSAVAGAPGLLAAGALLFIGFGVKVALVPMHTWLPDAHSQAPSGISAMLSGVVIEAGLVALLRALIALAGVSTNWGILLLGFGALNMIYGNLLALRQTVVKRMLAFSSLAHVGYMLLGLGVAFYSQQPAGAQGAFFHLINHGLMKGLAFLAAGALLYSLHLQLGDHDPLTIADLQGAATRYPLPALALSIAVLGLGGLPPLAGFMSKWQIFVAGVQTENQWITGLMIFAALNSVLSLGYYAPLVNALYRKQPSPAVQNGARVPLVMLAPLAILALAVVVIGIWPSLLTWFVAPAGKVLLGILGG
jgi:proton-translocating NADH-quinone oxidoreductase chain N